MNLKTGEYAHFIDGKAVDKERSCLVVYDSTSSITLDCKSAEDAEELRRKIEAAIKEHGVNE